MIFAVLPVKAPRNAKQRLRDFLPAPERVALARLLYKQTLSQLCQAERIDQVVVATNDPESSAYARSCGALVLEEDEQLSHSVSADMACMRCKEMGAKTVMLVPIDVPLVRAADFTELATATCPGLIVVPSADGTGTNALVRTPPDVIQSQFGPGSCRAHLEQAYAKGIPADVLRLRGIMFDLDTPEDITELLATAPESPAGAFLRDVCQLK